MPSIIDSRSLDIAKATLERLSYRGANLFDLTKVELYLAFRRRRFSSARWQRILLQRLKELAGVLLRDLVVSRNGWNSAKHIFVVDHLRPDHLETLLDIISNLDENEVSIITKNGSVRALLKDRFAYVFLGRYSASFSPLALGLQLYALTPMLARLLRSRLDVLSVVETLRVCLEGMKSIERYRNILDPEKITSVVTLCDVHMHEHAVAFVANVYGIKTYTLQHGAMGEQYTPVISDKIFVWGEATKRQLVDFGVPEHKIILSGNVILDNKSKALMPARDEIRRKLAHKYGFARDRPIVAYFATNWGPEENKALFEAFSSLLDLELFPIIKLRPNFGESQRAEYNRWLERSGSRDRVPVLLDEEDVFELLAAIDVLVTCHSTAAVEALAFGTVSVVLDLFEYMNLPEVLAHYHDCVVIKSSEELRSFISSIIDNHEELERRKKVSLDRSTKHFKKSEDRSVSRLIADHITSQDPVDASSTAPEEKTTDHVDNWSRS